LSGRDPRPADDAPIGTSPGEVRRAPCEWLLRLAMRAHSRRFRERHGREMLAHFADAWAARSPGARRSAVPFVVRAVGGVLGSGLSERFARDAARRSSYESEEPSRRTGFMDGFLHDLRSAVRALRKRPGFAVVVISTLALGLGANAAVFGLVDAVILKPLGYEDPDRLVRLYTTRREDPEALEYLTEPAFVHIRENARTIEPAAVYTYDVEGADLTDGQRPERIRVLRVGPGYFDVLGAPPLLGRTFTADEARDSATVAVVSASLWRRVLGGTPESLGRTITLDGAARTVVGVMPDGYADPLSPGVQVWLPLPLRTAGFAGWEWDNHWISAVARLQPGTTLAQAQAELDRLSRQQGEIEPDAARHVGRLVPLRDDVIGGVDTLVWVLAGAVGVLLLITCVNIAGLFVARGAAREQELAVRTALGSSRHRLFRQLVLESMLLALGGGAAGLIVAVAVQRGFAAAAPPALFPLGVPGTDARLFAAGLGLAAIAGLVTGTWPALRATRQDLAAAMREGGRGASEGRGTIRIRSGLVVLQFALAFVLLVGAAVLIRSFDRLRAVDLGVDPAGVWTFELHLPEERYTDPAARVRLYSELNDRLTRLPGVVTAGAVNHLPATGRFLSWGVRRATGGEDAPRMGANQRVIEGDYFGAARIPLVSGRTFGPDDQADAPHRVVVSEAIVQRLFPDEDPIGQQLRVGSNHWEIIGVVRDVAISARGATDPMIYHAHTQYADDRRWSLAQVVRLDGADPAFIDRARREVAALDPLLVVHEPRTLDEVTGRGVATERFAALLVTAFSALALLLAALGIYGVLAYVVSRRRREIGIRMALGARGGEVRRLVIAQGMRLAVLGIAGGLAAAFVAVRALESIVFDIGTRDPLAFLTAIAVLGGGALLACWIPSVSATRVDPIRVLGRE
jgi:predicted permease